MPVTRLPNHAAGHGVRQTTAVIVVDSRLSGGVGSCGKAVGSVIGKLGNVVHRVDCPRLCGKAAPCVVVVGVAADVSQTIYASTLPANYYEAVHGNFSHEDVDNAAKTDPMNEMLEVVSYAGHEFYSWGEDFEVNLAMRGNVRPLGRGHRLALVDDFIFWVLWTDGIEEMIDSYEGNIKSLADNDVYRLLAAGLEELDTVNAFFSSESQSLSHFNEVFSREKIEELSPGIRERLVAERDRTIRLKPYQALATGAGKDDEGYYLAIALVNHDEATARDNAKLLRQRIDQAKMVWGPQAGHNWADLIEGAVIESSGRLTLARLYGSVVEFWDCFGILGEGPYEPLLIHE